MIADLSDLHLVASALEGVAADWCICGGWAIDLFLDRLTRPHKDVDIAIKRADQLLFRRHLRDSGWKLEIANDGKLTPWEGEFLELPLHTIWCRKPTGEFFELLLNEWDDDSFRYRRDQSIGLPSDQATFISQTGFRILAPEMVLLYKSRDMNDNNSSDFGEALPKLSERQRQWLSDRIDGALL